MTPFTGKGSNLQNARKANGALVYFAIFFTLRKRSAQTMKAAEDSEVVIALIAQQERGASTTGDKYFEIELIRSTPGVKRVFNLAHESFTLGA